MQPRMSYTQLPPEERSSCSPLNSERRRGFLGPDRPMPQGMRRRSARRQPWYDRRYTHTHRPQKASDRLEPDGTEGPATNPWEVFVVFVFFQNPPHPPMAENQQAALGHHRRRFTLRAAVGRLKREHPGAPGTARPPRALPTTPGKVADFISARFGECIFASDWAVLKSVRLAPTATSGRHVNAPNM